MFRVVGWNSSEILEGLLNDQVELSPVELLEKCFQDSMRYDDTESTKVPQRAHGSNFHDMVLE